MCDVILVQLTRSLYYVYRFCICENRDSENKNILLLHVTVRYRYWETKL
ncbi:unnamed protein product [Brassica napus]|uniref:(rape) hypothetical protein n=1 Tax=Brassica napus TaxID=3708 RepID=A0A816QJB4_BRANA|nr:unnamed protein product [Brassica napus]